MVKNDIVCGKDKKKSALNTSVNSSYKGLFRLAWVSLLLTTTLLVVAAGIAFYIGQTLGTFQSFLNVIGSSYMFAIIGHTLLTIGIGLLVPVMMALFFALRGASTGKAVTGTGLGIAGIFVFIANTGNYFWLIGLAQSYARNCNSCQPLLQQEAYATNSVTLDLFTAQLLFAIAIMIISWTMMKTASFGKNPAYLGILSGVYAIIAPLVVLSINTDPNFVLTSYPATFAFVLYAVWFAMVATKFRSLSK